MVLNYLLSLLASILSALALPNELLAFGNPALGLFAFAPLFIALSRAESPREASLLGALYGAVSTLAGNYWLMNYGEFSVWTIGGTILGYVVFGLLLGPVLWRLSHSQPAYRPWLIAAAWVGWEYLKSVGFLGYPWGLSAYPFTTLTTINQLASVTGVWGICFLAALINALVAQWILDFTTNGETPRSHAQSRYWRRSPRATGFAASAEPHLMRSALMAATLILAAAAYGAIVLRIPIPIRDALDLVLVQQNADSWDLSNFETPLVLAQRESRSGIAVRDEPPDLVVWSETSLRFPYNENRSWYDRHPRQEPLAVYLRDSGVPLLTGSAFKSGEDYHNAALLIAPDGEVLDWYGKQHLVPFAEHIPLWELEPVRRFFREAVGISGVWTPAHGNRLIRIPGHDVLAGTPICFEDAFAYLCRAMVLGGADLLINLTNNSWSRTDSAQIQHFVAARYRAIETRRTLVRSTNAGYTAVVTPWGVATDALPMFETLHMRVTVPVYEPHAPTPYLLLGDYFPQLLLLVLVVLLAAWNDPRRTSS